MREPAEAALKGSIRLGNYLRRLRTGYGYSLRRVEERARAEGGEIDNSQLSRYEKGVCYPSFDKLRILATVFNVPVQAFSDVVDLEGFEGLRPQADDPEIALEEGRQALRRGEIGRAFASFERATELLDRASDADRDEQMLARARISLGHALARLGKLSLAERELRQALRLTDTLGPEATARALLALAGLHADQGDLFLAEIEADRAAQIARGASLPAMTAMSVHAVARVLADRGLHAQAIERYREACRLYEECGETFEAIRVRINIADCFVGMGKTREGVRLLKASLQEARGAQHRRLEAQAWSNLGAAYYRSGDPHRAQVCLRESDALAGGDADRHPDLLFFNAFYDWKMAREQANPTRERIAFGRLKLLRSNLERRLPEAEAFDAFVEGGRHHA